MRRITAPLRTLDAETQAYIRLVYACSGKRCPGIFIDGSSVRLGKPALGVGLAVLLVGGVVAFHSNKDAYAAAMLLAATVLLGGWLTWFGARELFGSGLFARFTYFDPTHVYQMAGRDVTITRVADARQVTARGAGVRFVGDTGRLFVPLPRRELAEFVGRFYDTARSLETDPRWGRLEPAGIGGVAKFVAVERRHPEVAGEIDLRVTTVPADPQRSGSAFNGGLIGAFAAAVVAFLLGVAAFQPMRDNGGFAAAQAAGAPGLRGYLTDERNTAHRDEARRLLAALYDGPIARVKSSGPPAQQAARDGFAAILETLRDAPQPVVSISVTEAGNAVGATLRETKVRTDLADSFGLFVGQELIAFAKNPDDKKAHVAVAYTPRPDGGVDWTIAFRTTPDAAPVGLPPQRLTGSVTAPDISTAMRNAVFMTLFGQPAPVVPPPVVDDGGEW